MRTLRVFKKNSIICKQAYAPIRKGYAHLLIYVYSILKMLAIICVSWKNPQSCCSFKLGCHLQFTMRFFFKGDQPCYFIPKILPILYLHRIYLYMLWIKRALIKVTFWNGMSMMNAGVTILTKRYHNLRASMTSYIYAMYTQKKGIYEKGLLRIDIVKKSDWHAKPLQHFGQKHTLNIVYIGCAYKLINYNT